LPWNHNDFAGSKGIPWSEQPGSPLVASNRQQETLSPAALMKQAKQAGREGCFSQRYHASP
jgi:hypothetical protein